MDDILLQTLFKNVTEKRKLCEYIAATALLIFVEMLKPDGSCVYDKFILMCCVTMSGRRKNELVFFVIRIIAINFNDRIASLRK